MKKIVGIAVLAAALAGCTQIDTGNIGVESTLGQVKKETLPPGMYFTLFKTVREISAKEIGSELNDLRPKSKDNVTLTDVDVTVYYKINPARAADIMIRYAGDLATDKNGDFVLGWNLVGRTSREAVYNEVAKFPATEMHTRRTDLSAAIRTKIQNELNADSGKDWFEITNVIIRNIVTDPRLEESIKAAAEVEFTIRKKTQEIELAKAEAERRRIEAEGEAAANRIISDSLSDKLIDLRRIEATREFAKTGTHTVLLGGDAKPLINVK